MLPQGILSLEVAEASRLLSYYGFKKLTWYKDVRADVGSEWQVTR